MPMADRSAPMVVGISVTKSTTSAIIGCTFRRHPAAKLRMVTTAGTKMMVVPGEQDVEGDLVRVFSRSAPSTRLIIRSDVVPSAVVSGPYASEVPGSAGHRERSSPLSR